MDERDLEDPEDWFTVPDVCGSCIAWRAGPDGGVDNGICRLRPELRTVPASMPKCPHYKARGTFTYEGTQDSSPKRRRAKLLRAVEYDADGNAVPLRLRRSTPEIDESEEPVEGEDRPARLERPAGAPTPSAVDLGEVTAGPVLKFALVELIRREHGNSRRELHSKYARGGIVEAVAGERRRAMPAERFFSMLDRLQSSLDGLDRALEAKRAGLGVDADELIDSTKKIRGTLTTFNVLFEHKEDYFSSK